jgi:hypothetical protein
LRTDGQPLPQTRRIIAADASSRFSIRLGSGNYRLTPLPGPRALPGRNITAEIAPGYTTWAAIRYTSKVQPI